MVVVVDEHGHVALHRELKRVLEQVQRYLVYSLVVYQQTRWHVTRERHVETETFLDAIEFENVGDHGERIAHVHFMLVLQELTILDLEHIEHVVDKVREHLC